MNLSWLDWLIVGIPCAVVFAVSFAMRRYLRSVADFLAASRCAGRYLICTAVDATGASITNTLIALEMFSKTGFSLQFWNNFTGFVLFLLALSGIITYRFRQTRALTFHQFFEMRYSKGLRAFASFMNFFSGLFNFGILPALGARFFVYFCGLPPIVPHTSIPTYGLVMVLLLTLSAFMALTGGQISVMVTDCLEGLISGIFYLVVAVAIICLVSYSQMQTTMLSGPPHQSYINPLDISGQKDFNGVYVILALLINLYYYRGNAWNAGFAAAARNPHESKMAGVLRQWRIFGAAAMAAMVSLGAFTLLHHSHFAPQAAQVEQRLASMHETDQLKTQMRMPVALSLLLPSGVRGAFCAIGLFGLLANLGSGMHGFGSVFIQDVLLPFRKKPLSPKQHILWLRCAALGVGLFAIVFGAWFKPKEYLIMVTSLIGALYLCVGATVWGGLYWKKGTNQGAWASMGVGAALSAIGLVASNFWPQVQPILIALSRGIGRENWAVFLVANAAKCPLNGQYLTAICFAGSGLAYVIVSLLTCKEDFDMDRMLHRGKYKVPELNSPGHAEGEPRSWLAKAMGIDRQYTRGDKIIAGSIFSWSLFWQLAAVVVLIWNYFRPWPDQRWCHYIFIQSVWATLVLAVITTIWFTIGGTRDIIDLFRALKAVKADDSDDGTVRAADKPETAASAPLH